MESDHTDDNGLFVAEAIAKSLSGKPMAIKHKNLHHKTL